MADERADFEGATAAAVGLEDESAPPAAAPGEPLPADQSAPDGYVRHSDLVAWVNEELAPKLAALAERDDAHEAAVEELRATLKNQAEQYWGAEAERGDTYQRYTDQTAERLAELEKKIETTVGTELAAQDEQIAALKGQVDELRAALEQLKPGNAA